MAEEGLEAVLDPRNERRPMLLAFSLLKEVTDNGKSITSRILKLGSMF